jgi:Spy/CpxP family protein refolding chaperone
MFFHPLLLGLLGGVVGAKLVARRHFGWHRHHHHFGRGRSWFRAVRSLGLDRRQKEELWSIAGELRESFGAVRMGGFQGIDSLVDAVTGDTFDKAGVEAVAQKQGDAVASLRDKMVRAAERVHQILTPEQRQRLREMIGGGGAGPTGPDFGPYRTAL